MWKKLGLLILIAIVVAVIWNYKLISYGLEQGRGQLHIIWNARDVSEILTDPATPDSLRQRLNYIDEVRTYAIDKLGLNDTDNYTSLYDQKGEPVLWVVTATKPFKFTPYTWKFPIVGKVPYKGFFRKDLALLELERLKKLGYDAGLRTVGGWSTLGWFSDPILSDMLGRSDGDLANLIVHELVHATIFVKDSVTFNENLASFIGDRGAIMFLKDHFGEGSEELVNYYTELDDEQRYASHILRGADKLDSLYSKNSSMDSVSLAGLKQSMIRDIVYSMDTLNLTYTYGITTQLRNNLPNNTYFMSFIRYRERQQDLDSLYMNAYNSDLIRMIGELKNKYPYL
jgi:predicted aminopeptidase